MCWGRTDGSGQNRTGYNEAIAQKARSQGVGEPRQRDK